MRLPVPIAGLILAAAALRPAWADPEASARIAAPAVKEASAWQDSQGVAAARLDPGAAAYREHASLAWFSVGSLAVGGVFYAIGRGMDRPNVSYTAGDRSRIATAVSVAGIGALVAAGTYLYYVHRDKDRAEDGSGWETELTGGPDGAGGMGVGARLTLPLPSLP